MSSTYAWGAVIIKWVNVCGIFRTALAQTKCSTNGKCYFYPSFRFEGLMFFPTSLLFPELLVSGNNFGKRKEEYQFEAVEPPTSASTPLLVKSALKGGLKNSGSAFFYGNYFCIYQRQGLLILTSEPNVSHLGATWKRVIRGCVGKPKVQWKGLS